MGNPARPFVSTPRHPLTGKKITISGRTPEEHARNLDRFERIRDEFRNGERTAYEVERLLRRMQHGIWTVERAASSYAERPDLTPHTVRRVRSFVKNAGAPLARHSVDELDAPTVNNWIESMRRTGLTSASITTHWRMLSMLVRYATERGWIAASPWGVWRPIIRPDGKEKEREACRSPEELERLFEAAHALDLELAASRLVPYLEPMIACAALLGLRQRELVALAWDGVDFDEGLVTIRAQGPSGAPVKGKLAKALRAPRYLFDVLLEHKGRLEALDLYTPKGPVFPSPTTSTPKHPRPRGSAQPLTSDDLRAVVVRAGLPHPERWSAHSLRDTFVTLDARGAHYGDLHAVAERSRHKSLSSLLRYLRSRTREIAPPGFDVQPRRAFGSLRALPAPPPEPVSDDATAATHKKTAAPGGPGAAESETGSPCPIPPPVSVGRGPRLKN